LSSNVESLKDMADRCNKDLEVFLGLYGELMKINEYEKKGKTERAVLALQKYGSRKWFLTNIRSIKKRVEQNTESLVELAGELSKVLHNQKCECYKCKGTGQLIKIEYIRERGQSIVPFRRTYDCDLCGGKGLIDIPDDVCQLLSYFIEIVNKFIESQKLTTQYLKIK